MLRWASVSWILLLGFATLSAAQEAQPTASEQSSEPSPTLAAESPPNPPEAKPTATEELFDPEELIRADENASTPTPGPSEAPTQGEEPAVAPTPGTAVEESRKKDLSELQEQAEKYFQSMNYTRPPQNNVLDLCKEILKQDPKNAKAHDLIAKMADHYKKKGDSSMKASRWDDAIEQYKRLIQIDVFGENKSYAQSQIDEAKKQQGVDSTAKEKPEVLLKKAEEAFKKKDYPTAKKYYQAILQKLPDDILAMKGLEKCNQLLGVEQEGTPQERISYFRQAGETFLEMENFQEAKFYYEKILSIDANDADARSKLTIIQDKMTPKGKLVVKFSGDPFWWQTKVENPAPGDEAKSYIELVIKIDGETAYYRTDSDIEEPVKSGKKGHAKNVYNFQDDYTFDSVVAGAHNLEVIVRGGAGEEAGQWSNLSPIQVEAGKVTEVHFKTTEDLDYSKRKSRMSGDFKIELVK